MYNKKKECLTCQNDFIPTRDWQIFCKRKCRVSYHRRKFWMFENEPPRRPLDYMLTGIDYEEANIWRPPITMGIYIWSRNKITLYVGSSIDVHKRLFNHDIVKPLDGDRIVIIKHDNKKIMEQEEIRFIVHLKPVYSGQLFPHHLKPECLHCGEKVNGQPFCSDKCRWAFWRERYESGGPNEQEE